MKSVTPTLTDLEQNLPKLAVFGIGAIEQHGPHLPVGTDWILAEELSRSIARRLDALWLPSLPFSLSHCHGITCGTVWLQPITFIQIVEDIIYSLYLQNIKIIIIINCHGANFILIDLIKELNQKYQNIYIILLPEPSYFINAIPQTDVHAGEFETSVMLFLAPQYVRQSKILDTLPPVGREFIDYAFLPQLSPTGVWGEPSKATAEEGRKYFERLINAYVDYIQKMLVK